MTAYSGNVMLYKLTTVFIHSVLLELFFLWVEFIEVHALIIKIATKQNEWVMEMSVRRSFSILR